MKHKDDGSEKAYLIKMPKSLWASIKIEAAERKKTMNNIIVECIEKYKHEGEKKVKSNIEKMLEMFSAMPPEEFSEVLCGLTAVYVVHINVMTSQMLASLIHDLYCSDDNK